jgi:hypothetical protein
MRITISEILGLTAIVAVYTAGLGLLAQEGLLNGVVSLPLLSTLPLVVFFGFFTARLFASNWQIGNVLTVFSVPHLKLWRLGCIGVFVALTIFCYVNRMQFQLIFLFIPVAVQVGREVAGRVAIGELGVAAMGYPLMWSEFWFALDSIEGRLHAVPRIGSRPGGWLPARSIRLPMNRVDEVRAILAAKQKEGTTDNTDGHG